MRNYAKEIMDLIKEADLKSYECNGIFNALREQDCVVGGKLWTHEDILSLIEEDDLAELDEQRKEEIAGSISTYIDTSQLDDCTDSEWNALEAAINDYYDDDECEL